MRRWLIVLAIVGCRDKSAPPPPAAGSAPAPAAHAQPTPAPPSAPTPVPTLPGSAAPDPRGMPPAESFAAEHEDRVWKAATEKTLHERLAKLSPQIECKATICRVTLAASGSAIDQIQQLQDIAQHVTLSREGDTIHAYLRFDRPEN